MGFPALSSSSAADGRPADRGFPRLQEARRRVQPEPFQAEKTRTFCSEYWRRRRNEENTEKD